MKITRFGIKWIALVVCLRIAEAAILRNAEDVDETAAVDYLTQFAYVDPATYRNEPVELEAALEQFQYMSGLDVTGKLDDATKEKMTQDRCGVPDAVPAAAHRKRKRRYMHYGGTWMHTHITWRLDGPATSDMEEEDVVAEITRAFSTWSDYSGLTFEQVFSNDEDITVKFTTYDHGDPEPFDGYGGVLAHAFFPVYGGDAHFDDSEDFSFNSYNGINLFQVAAHELGHALGLGHSPDQTSLMAAFYGGYQPDFQLGTDDVMGIQALYGENQCGYITRDSEFCNDHTTFDAITSTNDGSTYAFKGYEFFMLSPCGVVPSYPMNISSTWTSVPDDVDAALHWPDHEGWVECGRDQCLETIPGTTFIFKGADVYAFQDTAFLWHQPIATMFPGIPDDLDAAFVWAHDNGTYFIKGDQYYRYPTFAELEQTPADAGYPRDLSDWWPNSDHVLSRVDAALQYATNNKLFFFVDDLFYRFNDEEFKIEDDYPQSIAQRWYGCPANIVEEVVEEVVEEEVTTEAPARNIQEDDTDSNISGSRTMTSALGVTLTSFLVVLLSHLLEITGFSV